MSMTMSIGYAISSIILLSLFLVTLVIQLCVNTFHPVLCWSVILTTSTAGTTLSDYMDRTLGLGYAKGSLILVSGLLIVLAVWRLNEKTLSVSNINTIKAELFYWVAILFSNTLGTALGDFLADDSGLGFLGGALLVGGVIALIALASYLGKLNQILLFWLAFILTRPFGATFGDLLTKPIEKGGVGFGTVGSSMILAMILMGFVVYSMRVKRATN